VVKGKTKRAAGGPAREAAAIERARVREENRPAREEAAKERERTRRRLKTKRELAREPDSETGYARLAWEAREATKHRKGAERLRAAARRAKGLAGHRMLRLRTPPWLTADERATLTALYPAPTGFHNDHIVAIAQHPDVVGLHVPWNIQRLPGRANIKRRFTCTTDEAEEYIRRGMAVWRWDLSPTGEVPWEHYPRPPGAP
jgi:hypothetical protein